MTNTQTRTNMSQKTMVLVQTGVLAALMFLLDVTGLGYLKFGLAVEITIMMIPVIIGAIVCGPSSGAVLGGVFGLTSFLQAVMGKSAFGVFMLELSPVGTFFLCMVPRILVGLLAGFLFSALRKIDKTKLWSFAVTSLCGALMNTVFFMGMLVLLFWNNDTFLTTMQSWGLATDHLFPFLAAFVGTNGLIEAVVCFLVGAALAKALVYFLPERK